MLKRIILALLLLGLAAVPLQIGDQYLSGVVGHLPTDPEYRPFWTAVAWASVIILAGSTLITAIYQLVQLFAPKAKYQSQGFILWVAILLCGDALAWGTFLTPLTRYQYDISRWFLGGDSLDLLVAWTVVTPAVLLALGFVREVFRALSEYEMSAGYNQYTDGKLTSEFIMLKNRTDKQVTALAKTIGDLLVSNNNSPQYDKVVALLEKLDQRVDSYENKFDGIFTQLRGLKKAETPVPAPTTPDSAPTNLRVIGDHAQPAS